MSGISRSSPERSLEMSFLRVSVLPCPRQSGTGILTNCLLQCSIDLADNLGVLVGSNTSSYLEPHLVNARHLTGYTVIDQAGMLFEFID